MLSVLACVALACTASVLVDGASKGVCAPTDNAGDCAGLMAFATATGYQSWTKNKHWGEDKTVCGWEGIDCTKGRVTGIHLKVSQ